MGRSGRVVRERPGDIQPGQRGRELVAAWGPRFIRGRFLRDKAGQDAQEMDLSGRPRLKKVSGVAPDRRLTGIHPDQRGAPADGLQHLEPEYRLRNGKARPRNEDGPGPGDRVKIEIDLRVDAGGMKFVPERSDGRAGRDVVERRRLPDVSGKLKEHILVFERNLSG